MPSDSTLIIIAYCVSLASTDTCKQPCARELQCQRRCSFRQLEMVLCQACDTSVCYGIPALIAMYRFLHAGSYYSMWPCRWRSHKATQHSQHSMFGPQQIVAKCKSRLQFTAQHVGVKLRMRLRVSSDALLCTKIWYLITPRNFKRIVCDV
eukprot:3067673-Pleurochrysis_carterae.AAC.2